MKCTQYINQIYFLLARFFIYSLAFSSLADENSLEQIELFHVLLKPWIGAVCLHKNMFNFQFNSHQFQLTSHFLCQLGKPQVFGVFWEDYHDILTVEVWLLFLSIHTSESVLFSPTLPPPPSPRMVVVVRQGWPLFCQCTSCYMQKVCLQSAWVPPSSHLPHQLPLKCQIPFLAFIPDVNVICSIYSMLIPNWDTTEASTVDLPLTHSPGLLQSMLYRWFLSLYFPCLSLFDKTGRSLAPSPLALSHFFNQFSATFGHIWFESQIDKLTFSWFSSSSCVQVSR